MTHVTITDSVKEQLGTLKEPLALFDESGKPLGTFTPVTKLTNHQRIAMTLPDHLLDSKLPVEELNRRLREEPGVPHEEVMRKVRQY